MAVREGWRGRFFEDFEVGDVYEHPLGRTVTTTDNTWFTLLTQNTAPMLFLLFTRVRGRKRSRKSAYRIPHSHVPKRELGASTTPW
jgi:hypothetical protein